MKIERLHIAVRFMLMLLLLQTVVLVAACSKSNDAYAEQEQQPTVLTIYVYAPEKAVATRSDMGDVDATSAESRVNSLQIWVFEHEDTTLVGYLSPTVSLLNSEQAEAYLLDVSALFAETHPNVDVYVLANAAGMGLGAGSTRSALEDAVMSGDNFGISQPTTAVPPGGMPMSGVLRDQPVCGDNPVLRIGSATEMATVRLKRMVSKLRFVFTCSEESTERVSIDGITLDANTIPTEEYLFLGDDGNNYHIGNTYVTTAATLSTGIATLASCTAPLEYVYTAGTEAQDYEELISGGVTAGDLSQAGPYYLRESDCRLSGTIRYTVGEVSRQATFQMANAGDFSRNHTWIVYGYFISGGIGDLQLNSVFVKDWNNVNRNHELFNW